MHNEYPAKIILLAGRLEKRAALEFKQVCLLFNNIDAGSYGRILRNTYVGPVLFYTK
jgi:hypothetical protein